MVTDNYRGFYDGFDTFVFIPFYMTNLKKCC